MMNRASPLKICDTIRHSASRQPGNQDRSVPVDASDSPCGETATLENGKLAAVNTTGRIGHSGRSRFIRRAWQRV
jgi:hypothetical protein